MNSNLKFLRIVYHKIVNSNEYCRISIYVVSSFKNLEKYFSMITVYYVIE